MLSSILPLLALFAAMAGNAAASDSVVQVAVDGGAPISCALDHSVDKSNFYLCGKVPSQAVLLGGNLGWKYFQVTNGRAQAANKLEVTQGPKVLYSSSKEFKGLGTIKQTQSPPQNIGMRNNTLGAIQRWLNADALMDG